MKAVLNWVVSHPEIITSAIGLIASIVICCIRKKPVKVVDTLREKILFKLPVVIDAAEKKFGAGHGEEKLKFVIDYFTWEFSENGLIFGDSYKEFIKYSVEQILSTPQKK